MRLKRCPQSSSWLGPPALHRRRAHAQAQALSIQGLPLGHCRTLLSTGCFLSKRVSEPDLARREDLRSGAKSGPKTGPKLVPISGPTCPLGPNPWGQSVNRTHSFCGFSSETLSRCSGLNRGPTVYETVALPLSYTGEVLGGECMARRQAPRQGDGRYGKECGTP